MSDLDTIFSMIPIDDVAAKVGIDKQTAERAVAAAIPALMGGMKENAKDPQGEKSLAKAIDSKDPGLVIGGINLGDIDIADGAKIVKNIFGPKTDDVEDKLQATNVDKNIIHDVLPIVAPIVLSFVASKISGGSAPAKKNDSGGWLGDLLGNMMGGGSSTKSSGSNDLLGSVLGSVMSNGGSDAIGNLLGGLLGGGKR